MLALHDVEVITGSEEADEISYYTSIQRAINAGSWSFEGSFGRSMMAAIEDGRCFLEAGKQLGIRDPLQDNYGIARLCQIIGNYFGGDLPLGIDRVSRLDTDNMDNGTYIVGRGFTIESRKYVRGTPPKTLGELTKDDVEKYEEILSEVLKANKKVFGS